MREVFCVNIVQLFYELHKKFTILPQATPKNSSESMLQLETKSFTHVHQMNDQLTQKPHAHTTTRNIQNH